MRANDIAAAHIAIRVALGHLPQRGPRAYVAPAAVQRYNATGVCFFHNGIIDGFLRCAREGFRLQSYETEVIIGICDSRVDSAGDIRF